MHHYQPTYVSYDNDASGVVNNYDGGGVKIGRAMTYFRELKGGSTLLKVHMGTPTLLSYSTSNMHANAMA